jgi:predicted transcriptional regulator
MKIGKLRKLYSLTGTAEILEYIYENPGCTKKDLREIALSQVVSQRLNMFKEYGLVHQDELMLTESGKKFLSLIHEIESLEHGYNE